MSVQSVERALDLLTEVARRPGGLVDLATRAELPLSTASRLLGTLTERGMLGRDDEGVYVVGPTASAVGKHALHGPSIQAVAQRHVASLSDDLDEAAGLSIPLDNDSLSILQIDSPRPVQAQDWTGHRWPLTAGGSGLVMVATWDDARVEDLLAAPMRSLTSETPTEPAEIRRQLKRIRRTRVCWTKGGYVSGLSSAASAVTDPSGTAVASMFCYGPSYRLPGSRTKREIEAAVLAAADAVSAELAIGWPESRETEVSP